MAAVATSAVTVAVAASARGAVAAVQVVLPEAVAVPRPHKCLRVNHATHENVSLTTPGHLDYISARVKKRRADARSLDSTFV